MTWDGIKVLLIDDDEDEFVLMEDFLGADDSEGYCLEWEPEYERALKRLREGGYDVYLVDFQLGRHNGLELLHAIRQEGLDRAVIMLTGMGNEAIDEAALGAGAYDYLVKSDISQQTLKRSIRYAAERHRVEVDLKRHAEMLANVHDAVFTLGPSGIIETWNARAETVFGFTAEEVLGNHVKMLLPEDDQERFEARTYPALLRDEQLEFAVWCHHRSGRRIALAIRAQLLKSPAGEAFGALICANDITEQKRLEQMVVEVSESEQRRIGQDIHDDLCQQLASIGCLSKVLEKRLSEVDSEAASQLNEIGEMVSLANQRAREIARGLVPSVLETEGLPGALEALASRTRRAFGVNCACHCDEALYLEDPEMASHLYRIAQEAVSNAVRHGHPAEVLVELIQHDDAVVLSVKDDGQGIRNPEVASGIGMLTMASRAESLGGSLDIRTGRGEGTQVTCRIPARNEEAVTIDA